MTYPAESPPITHRVADARAWVFHQALPFWSTTGVDGDWGFVEELTLDGRPAEVGYKRLRVQARQVYVFSHAAVLGFRGALDAAGNGWRFMREFGWLPDGGWARTLGPRGGVLDPTLDLYDQAFAILAAAWWSRAADDEEAIRYAHRTLDHIDAKLASPTGNGWLSDDGPQAEHLQNPHMHLLEAVLALDDVTDDGRAKEFAQRLLELFRRTLFDRATGTLAERYDRAWRRMASDHDRVIEPGHHYEWVWLLDQARGRGLFESQGEDDALFEFAERHGWSSGTSLIYDELLDNGSVRASGHRSWPHTEALKAHLVRFERAGFLDGMRLSQVLDALFDVFLQGPQPGTWTDRVTETGEPNVAKVPASTLYHVFLALSELLRLEPKLCRTGTDDA